MSLDHAGVVTARELSRDTARVVETVVKGGEPAIVTKHGRLAAVLVSVQDFGEAALLNSAAAGSFLDTLGAHDVGGVAEGLSAGDAIERVSAGRLDKQPDVGATLPNRQVATVRRLNQDTSGVLNEVRESGRPVFITRYGRWLVALLPIPVGIEAELLESVAARVLRDSLGTGVHDGVARGLTVDEAAAHVRLDGAMG